MSSTVREFLLSEAVKHPEVNAILDLYVGLKGRRVLSIDPLSRMQEGTISAVNMTHLVVEECGGVFCNRDYILMDEMNSP